jgi:hypothetical protein
LFNVTEIDIHSPSVSINGQSSSCLASFLARIYFISFVLISEYVLINIVVGVLMKHLDVYISFKLMQNYFILFDFFLKDSEKMVLVNKEIDKEIHKQLDEKERNRRQEFVYDQLGKFCGDNGNGDGDGEIGRQNQFLKSLLKNM